MSQIEESQETTVVRRRKLSKEIEGTVVTFTVDGEESKSYDAATLSGDIQAKLMPFGLGHKLGDAAAGKSGAEEIFSAIDAVWETLQASQWSSRAPAKPKVDLEAVRSRVGALPEAERAAAEALMRSLGLF